MARENLLNNLPKLERMTRRSSGSCSWKQKSGEGGETDGERRPVRVSFRLLVRSVFGVLVVDVGNWREKRGEGPADAENGLLRTRVDWTGVQRVDSQNQQKLPRPRGLSEPAPRVCRWIVRLFTVCGARVSACLLTVQSGKVVLSPVIRLHHTSSTSPLSCVSSSKDASQPAKLQTPCWPCWVGHKRLGTANIQLWRCPIEVQRSRSASAI